MLNEPIVYQVRSGEGDFPYIKFDPLSSSNLGVLAPLVCAGRQIKDFWVFKNPIKEGLGDFAEFSGIVGAPTNVIVIREDVFGDAVLSAFFKDSGELIRLTFDAGSFLLFNPTNCIDVAHPKTRDDLYPELLSRLLPTSGFFRIPNSLFIYYVEPSTGGLKKHFYTSGMIGLRFEEQKVVDE